MLLLGFLFCSSALACTFGVGKALFCENYANLLAFDNIEFPGTGKFIGKQAISLAGCPPHHLTLMDDLKSAILIIGFESGAGR